MMNRSFSIFPHKRPCISNLIEERKWKKLLTALNSGKYCQYDDRGMKTCLCQHFLQHSHLLHVACKFNAPLYIVEKIFTNEPDSIFEVCNLQQSPLHVALSNNNETDVIKFLLANNKRAAQTQDSKGRAPIHLVFCHEKWEDVSSTEVREMILLLCAAAPTSPMLEDSEGKNAVEYALESGADFEVLSVLQGLTKKGVEFSADQDKMFRSSSDALLMSSFLKKESSFKRRNFSYPQAGRRLSKIAGALRDSIRYSIHGEQGSHTSRRRSSIRASISAMGKRSAYTFSTSKLLKKVTSFNRKGGESNAN